MPKPVALKDSEESKLFYDNRYSQGYMEDWDLRKKQRIFEMIRELRLPDIGCALDFGCGNGVWTDIIKKALPSWEVFGTDISTKPISNARRRHPYLHFFELSNEREFNEKFDTLYITETFTIFSLFQADGTISTFETTPRPTVSWAQVFTSPYIIVFNTIFVLSVTLHTAIRKRKKLKLKNKMPNWKTFRV